MRIIIAQCDRCGQGTEPDNFVEFDVDVDWPAAGCIKHADFVRTKPKVESIQLCVKCAGIVLRATTGIFMLHEGKEFVNAIKNRCTTVHELRILTYDMLMQSLHGMPESETVQPGKDQ